MRISTRHLPMVALLFVAAAGASPQASAPAAAPTASAAQSETTFKREELDQMTAPIALYPDTLLAQVLMASTYPGDVADAAKWSKQNKNVKGEAAVKQVENQPWDPSVQSLVAFPQVLDTLSQDSAWVQKLGDAFLAQPDAVMASVQRLRNQAQAAGNLKSNEQQVVKTEAATGAMVAESVPQTIIIESSDPEVVYVPSYSSSVYGPWAYPAYPPYYYGYYPGAALFSFGVGVAIGGALWGDCNWGGGDIDIDVNNSFNRNTNRTTNRTTNRGDRTAGRGEGGKWQHNSANRDGVPYRDKASRDQFGRQSANAGQRDGYRGRDPARDAQRDRASQSMSRQGFETPARSNQQARDRANTASRQMDQRGGQAGMSEFDRGRNAQARDASRQQSRQGQPSNNAFAGASNPGQSRASSSRGRSSYGASQRSGSRGAGAGAGRQMSRPARGGGGRRR